MNKIEGMKAHHMQSPRQASGRNRTRIDAKALQATVNGEKKTAETDETEESIEKDAWTVTISEEASKTIEEDNSPPEYQISDEDAQLLDALKQLQANAEAAKVLDPEEMLLAARQAVLNGMLKRIAMMSADMYTKKSWNKLMAAAKSALRLSAKPTLAQLKRAIQSLQKGFVGLKRAVKEEKRGKESDRPWVESIASVVRAANQAAQQVPTASASSANASSANTLSANPPSASGN